MALLDRPNQPEDNSRDSDIFVGDLTLTQQFEVSTTQRMLQQASKDQLIEFAMKLLTFHMRYKNTQNAIVHEWGMKPPN